jgi:hypothetical protein
LANFLATDFSRPTLEKFLTFPVPNRMSPFPFFPFRFLPFYFTFPFHSLGRVKQFFRDTLWHLVTYYVLPRGIFTPQLATKLEDTPVVGCPLLFSQYIRTYPPYLNAVSSIRDLMTRQLFRTVHPRNLLHPYNYSSSLWCLSLLCEAGVLFSVPMLATSSEDFVGFLSISRQMTS